MTRGLPGRWRTGTTRESRAPHFHNRQTPFNFCHSPPAFVPGTHADGGNVNTLHLVVLAPRRDDERIGARRDHLTRYGNPVPDGWRIA